MKALAVQDFGQKGVWKKKQYQYHFAEKIDGGQADSALIHIYDLADINNKLTLLPKNSQEALNLVALYGLSGPFTGFKPAALLCLSDACDDVREKNLLQKKS